MRWAVWLDLNCPQALWLLQVGWVVGRWEWKLEHGWGSYCRLLGENMVALHIVELVEVERRRKNKKILWKKKKKQDLLMELNWGVSKRKPQGWMNPRILIWTVYGPWHLRFRYWVGEQDVDVKSAVKMCYIGDAPRGPDAHASESWGLRTGQVGKYSSSCARNCSHKGHLLIQVEQESPILHIQFHEKALTVSAVKLWLGQQHLLYWGTATLFPSWGKGGLLKS